MRPFFPRQRAAELAVVNLYADRVEVGRVCFNEVERPRVTLLAHFSSTDHAQTLHRIRRELRLKQFRCATVLSARHYQLQLLDTPPSVPEAEMKSAIRWRLKDYLDYPVESATVDVLALPADKATAGRGQSVYAVSARNADIEACMKLFAAAKIPLVIIDVSETAQRNLATLFETDHRAVAMLSFSDEGGLLTFSAQGELYLSRRIEISLEQLSSAGPEMREQMFERIALELQRSLDHFDRQFSSIPLARLLLAPVPDELGLAAYLAGNLSAPVQSVDLAEVLDFHDVPELREPAEQMLRWQTLGAALRVDIG